MPGIFGKSYKRVLGPSRAARRRSSDGGLSRLHHCRTLVLFCPITSRRTSRIQPTAIERHHPTSSRPARLAAMRLEHHEGTARRITQCLLAPHEVLRYLEHLAILDRRLRPRLGALAPKAPSPAQLTGRPAAATIGGANVTITNTRRGARARGGGGGGSAPRRRSRTASPTSFTPKTSPCSSVDYAHT